MTQTTQIFVNFYAYYLRKVLNLHYLRAFYYSIFFRILPK